MKFKTIRTLLMAAGLTVLTSSCNDNSNDNGFNGVTYNSLVTYDMTVASADNDVTKDIAYFTF